MHDQTIGIKTKANRDWINIYPKSFSSLMELYEENYIGLRRLCPYLKTMEGNHISRLKGNGHNLYLTVLDKTPHTTTLKLTYRMQDGDDRPNLKIRMYHDARQVEVLSRQCRITGEELKTQRSPDESALLCRWRLNRFLLKWLKYCLRQGHIFQATIPSSPNQLHTVSELLD